MLKHIKNGARKAVGYGMQAAGVGIGVAAATGTVVAQTTDDITSTITTVSGYQTAAVAVGVAVLLFVLGRKVVRKMI